MDFGGGMAVGMGAGIGSGIAIGVSSGRQQAKAEMRAYIEQNGMTIQDRFGKPVKLDEFMGGACKDATCCGSQSKKWLCAALLLGLVVAGVVLYLVLQ